MRIHRAFLVVATLFVAVMFHSKVHASLNLTFDVTKLTYSWTGTATSSLITVPIDSRNVLDVIGQPYAGGLGAITMPGGPITVTLLNSIIDDYFVFAAGDGSPNVIMNFPSIHAPVAYFDWYSFGGATEAESIVLQIVGNGVEVSYAGVNPIVRRQISNMEGVPLYLRHYKNLFYVDPPNQIEILPTQIGSIHVVPEPSTYALLAMTAAGALWARFRPLTACGLRLEGYFWGLMRHLLALLLTATSILAADHALLTLEQSTGNLNNWQAISVTAAMLTSDGKIDGGALDTNSKFYRMRISQGTLTPTLAMVTVQGGTLPSGSPLAGRSVGTFAIAKYEVTRDEWLTVRTYAVEHGYSDLAMIGAGSAGNHPVQSVNWYDVVKWCNAKSEMEGLTPVYQVAGATYKVGLGGGNPTIVAGANGYRLPSEAEWEWAARGGVSTRGYIYSGSDDIDAVCWYYYNTSDETKAVGQKQANELGLYDMSGNVWEWCFDSPYSSYRRVRGGSWQIGLGDSWSVVARGQYETGYRYFNIGFRPARSLGN